MSEMSTVQVSDRSRVRVVVSSVSNRRLLAGMSDPVRALSRVDLPAFLQPVDLPVDDPPVGLHLGLAGAAGADGSLLPLQVLPHTRQPGQEVLVLGQGHLQAALAGAGPLGENVQDEGGPVHHRHPQLLRQHPLLGGGEGVVEDHDVRPQTLDQLLDLRRLALADEGAGVGGGPVLQHRPQAQAPRRVQQGGQLVQGFVAGVFLLGEGGGVQARQDGPVDLFQLGFFKHIGMVPP